MKKENVLSVEIKRSEAVQLNHLLSSGFMVGGIGANKQLALIDFLIKIEKEVKIVKEFETKTIDCLKPADFEKLKEDPEKKEELSSAVRAIELGASKVLEPYYDELIKIPFDGLSLDELKIIMETNEKSLTLTGMSLIRKYFVK